MTQEALKNCPICNKTSEEHSLKQLDECFEKFLNKGTLIPSQGLHAKDETKVNDTNDKVDLS